jgi:hypothetical protein
VPANSTSGLTQEDIDASISIFGDPLTAEQIIRMRARLEGSFGDSLSSKVIMYTPPLFGLELVAGLAVAAFEENSKSGPRASLAYVRTDDDWTASPTASKYVEKVRAMNRPLIQAEVSAIRSQIAMERSVTAVVTTVATASGNAVMDLVGLRR